MPALPASSAARARAKRSPRWLTRSGATGDAVKRPALLGRRQLTAAASVGVVLALTRPAPPPAAPQRPMAVEREADDPPAARDEANHFCPWLARRWRSASPGARRYRYDDAAALATGPRAFAL